jgi:hypothetical protein
VLAVAMGADRQRPEQRDQRILDDPAGGAVVGRVTQVDRAEDG